MPIQAPQWTEFLSCPVCYNVFNETHYRPISLACGHTVCRSCLCKLQQRKCPFDQSLICREVEDLPVNFALLQLVCATASPENKKECVPEEFKRFYEASKRCVEELALLLKPVASSSTGSIISVSSSSANSQAASNCALSRPMQRKLITLVSCQLVEEEGRGRALRAARSLGERTVTELILQHQNPQQLSSNLWASVRGRGCQFLGPAMQEEVLKLILLALEDGSALSRKVLVLFVVQRLETHFPQASKTAIGHVVQLLYRASCFKVTKRDEESSLMQLKEEYRTYETLRREHDSQVVQIAMEAGLRIAPDQWSSLLYGDATHKSHMQSIIDKLQTPQTFSQSVNELLIALQRTGDPHNLQRLRPELEFLSSIDPSPDIPVPSWENLDGVMKAVRTVVEGLVEFLQDAGTKKHEFLTPFNARYKTSMCRDYLERRNCPRGASCTFAHSEDELEKYRHRNKRGFKSNGTVSDYMGDDLDIGYPEDGNSYRNESQDLTPILKAMNINVKSGTLMKHESTGDKHSGGTYNQVYNDPIETPPNVVTAVRMPLDIAPPYAVDAQPSVSIAPPISNYMGSIMAPTGEAVLTNGGRAQIQQVMTPPIVPDVKMMGNYPMQHGMMPGMGQAPVMADQPNPAMMQMGPMQGMMPPPFIPPFGGPGPAIHGPRFPMHPMMYHGQYPYMQPYMPYYPQGFMPPDNSARVPYDNYYTSLNPFAEPWNPVSTQRPHLNPNMKYPEQLSSGQMETCHACSQRQQEEQRQQQQQQSLQGEGHSCKLHSPKTQDVNSQGERVVNYVNKPNAHQYVSACNEVQQTYGKKVPVDFERNGGQNENFKPRQQSEEEAVNLYTKDISGQGQKKHQGHPNQPLKQQQGQYRQIDEPYRNEQQNSQQLHPQGQQGQVNYSKVQGQMKQQGLYHEQYSDAYRNSRRSSSTTDDTNPGQDYDRHDWSYTEDREEMGDRGEEKLQYQQQHGDRYPSQYSDQEPYQQKRNYGQQQKYFVENNEKHTGRVEREKKPGKVPILIPTVPNAQLHRQSLKNLQERRNTLLAQLQELNKQFEGHYGDEDELLEEIWNQDSVKLEKKGLTINESLPNLFRPHYELIQVDDESDTYTKTLEHPHPMDVGPIRLKSEVLSQGNMFERLGAISGVPPRSVNDSIMTSWMTDALKNNPRQGAEDYDCVNYSMMDPAQFGQQMHHPSSQQNFHHPQSAQYVGMADKREIKPQTNKSTEEWKNFDKDFPYWKDVTSNLDSPMPTPPTTPKPSPVVPVTPMPSYYSSPPSHQRASLPSHQNSMVGMYSANSTSVSSSSSRQFISSSNTANRQEIMSAHSASNVNQSNYNSNTRNWNNPYEDTAQSTFYNYVGECSHTNEYRSDNSMYPGKNANYGNGDDFTSRSTLFSLSSSNTNFDEECIPFVQGSPTISKFGPISRVSAKQMGKSSGLLPAVADETVNIVPVTAVTPLERPPLPNASTVPSRFSQDETGHYAMSKGPVEPVVTDKLYSLWASEVNILEQKAKDANTEDEKLSVKLQAVEMQITLKQQEIKQAQIVNANSSEYIKQKLHSAP